MKKIELLAPAGNLKKLKLAIDYGADAVYLGGQKYGLRSSSDNFSLEEIVEGVNYADKRGASVYVTTNIYAHSQDISGFKEYVMKLEEAGVRGIIVSDPAYIKIAKEFAPKLEIHISTQQSITNSLNARFFQQIGADRVVLARELTVEEIGLIKSKNPSLEIEVFIHGAVCSSYSGRCTISNHLTMRDSNRGGCCQSCRWDFEIFEKNNGDFIKSELNDENKQFSMSSKDLITLTALPHLIEAGVDSLKIEGRMKSYHYLATVVKVYRKMIDTYYEDPENFKIEDIWLEELAKAEARPVSEGALVSNYSKTSQIFGNQYQKGGYDYCGIVLKYDEKTSLALVEQRNFFCLGDEIELFNQEFNNFTEILGKIYNEEMEEIPKANHPLMKVWIPVSQKVEQGYIVRRKLGEKK